MSKIIYYAGNCNYLIRFEDYDRLKIFLENEPAFHRVYGQEARTYPQYNIVSDPRLVEEMVVDHWGYNKACIQITYWGRYDGIHFYSTGGCDLTQEVIRLDAMERMANHV